MVDITQLKTDVDVGLSLVEKLIPFVAMFNAKVAAFLTAAIMSVRTVESKLGLPTAAALLSVTDHLTPGKPNSPALH